MRLHLQMRDPVSPIAETRAGREFIPLAPQHHVDLLPDIRREVEVAAKCPDKQDEIVLASGQQLDEASDIIDFRSHILVNQVVHCYNTAYFGSRFSPR